MLVKIHMQRNFQNVLYAKFFFQNHNTPESKDFNCNHMDQQHCDE